MTSDVSKNTDAPVTQRISMRDIANRLNVSRATISRALRNRPEISKALCKKVQRTAAEMGYKPDPVLSALVQYRQGKSLKPVTSELAWINGWLDPAHLRSYREFDLYWQGAAAEAERAGYHLEEFCINKNTPVSRLETILMARNIRGMLIPPQGTNIDWGNFGWNQFSVVRFGYSFPTLKAHIVTSDQLTDGLLACKNIWERGYRHIGLVVSPQSTTRFSAGYMYAHISQTQQLPPQPFFVDRLNLEKNKRPLREWLKRVHPDAILTDVPELRQLLSDIGYQVPKDVGLATMTVLDGNVDAGIDQNSEEIGRAAMQMLISLINHHECGIPSVCRELLVEGKWVDGSTLPIKPPR